MIVKLERENMSRMADYILKKALVTVIVILTLTGCKENSESCHWSKGIDTILSDYIDRHPQDSVIVMQFHGVEDRTILNIQHSPYYPWKDLVDGCFIYKDKLAVYCLFDKQILMDSLIDSTFASDRTILSNYQSWEEVRCDYDGNPDSEYYLVKSRDNIVNAEQTDLNYKEIVSDTIGIRNESINNILNQRLNKHNASITAIRFVSFENSDYFMISEVCVYTKTSLSGCLKRNGRIITFYGVDKLHNQELIDRKLIHKELSQLDNFKELSSNWFNFVSCNGDIFKILPKGDVERVSFEKMSDKRSYMLT